MKQEKKKRVPYQTFANIITHRKDPKTYIFNNAMFHALEVLVERKTSKIAGLEDNYPDVNNLNFLNGRFVLAN